MKELHPLSNWMNPETIDLAQWQKEEDWRDFARDVLIVGGYISALGPSDKNHEVYNAMNRLCERAKDGAK